MVRVAFKASSMDARERSRTCRCKPDPPWVVGSKSFSPLFGITGRAIVIPLLAHNQPKFYRMWSGVLAELWSNPVPGLHPQMIAPLPLALQRRPVRTSRLVLLDCHPYRWNFKFDAGEVMKGAGRGSGWLVAIRDDSGARRRRATRHIRPSCQLPLPDRCLHYAGSTVGHNSYLPQSCEGGAPRF